MIQGKLKVEFEMTITLLETKITRFSIERFCTPKEVMTKQFPHYLDDRVKTRTKFQWL